MIPQIVATLGWFSIVTNSYKYTKAMLRRAVLSKPRRKLIAIMTYTLNVKYTMVYSTSVITTATLKIVYRP